MRVLLRADSGIKQGTGHLMRCLTLAEELLARGHDVHLMTAPMAIGWLDAAVLNSGVTVHECVPDALSIQEVLAVEPDWLVVDSYQIPADRVTAAAAEVKVLAIVDGDDRSIDATLYLDQNLGAESIPRRAAIAGRFLSGPDFALVRRAVLDARREEPWKPRGDRPGILCFMGGTDPSGTIVEVAAALASFDQDNDLVFVAPEGLHAPLRAALPHSARAGILPLTPELAALFAAADLVVSAAGTSAWDLCTLGIPTVLVAVVDNQRASLRQAVERGLTLGVDIVEASTETLAEIGPLVGDLIDDSALRERLSRRSLAAFDGRGAKRVVDRLEAACVAEDRRERKLGDS